MHFELRQLLVAAVCLPGGAILSSSNAWGNVAIGGGGYVTGLFAHPISGDMYSRTDVGGAYKLNRTANVSSVSDSWSWQPLVDAFTPENKTYYSIESLALDPQDSLTLYVAVGSYAESWGTTGAILHSEDAGNSWAPVTPVSWPVQCGGNDDKRWGGEKLHVHPSDSKTVLFGGRDGSVWRTTDGFNTFTNVSLPGATPVQGIGIQALTFVTLPDGVTVAALAAVNTGVSAPGGGLWLSYGDPSWSTWTRINGSSSAVMRLKADISAQHTGTVVATADDGVYLCTPTKSSGSSSWSYSCTLSLSNGRSYSGLDMNGHNPLDIVVVPYETDGGTALFRTVNGGKDWFQVAWERSSTVPWYPSYLTKNNAASALVFDPTDISGNTLLLSDWYGVWASVDLNVTLSNTSAVTHWFNHEHGHEEVCVFTISCPPVGAPLYTGHADIAGFAHWKGPDVYPSSSLWDMQYIYSIDYTEATVRAANGMEVPETMVYTVGNGWQGESNGYYGYHQDVVLSHDGGMTANGTNWDTTYQSSTPQKVAIHPWDGSNFVISSESGANRPAVVTFDGGNTYLNITDLPYGEGGGTFWAPVNVVADKHVQAGQPGVFYHYFMGNNTAQARGTLYRSAAGGAPGSWQAMSTTLPHWNMWMYHLAVPPAGTSALGDVWMAFGDQGLWHSLDGGATVSSLPAVRSAIMVALGPFPPSLTRPRSSAGYVVYIMGIVGTDTFTQPYVSVDLGHTWHSLHTDGQGLGDSPSQMTASRQEPGVVFIGTGGRGVYYFNATAVIAAACCA